MQAALKSIALFCLSLFSIQAYADESFPYRDDYSDVPIIELSDLANESEDVFIVDVRSQLEFDVIHIANAVNIPMSNRGFEAKVKELQPTGKKIITYCNGHTCKKSYKAARRLIAAGLENVYAYDSGIFDWTQANPDKSVLMGVQPAAAEKLIPKSKLAPHMLDSESFLSQATGENAILIDVRDNFQRDDSKSLKQSRSVPVDRFYKWLKAGNGKDQTLYSADAVGKQVRWLQYYLVEFGYKNYYFLKGGVAGL